MTAQDMIWKNILEKADIKKEIEVNLKNIEKGNPLTIPLAVLNGEFKKVYKEKFGEFERKDKEEVKAHQKAYHKAYNKAYNQRPKVKAYHKAYYQKKKLEKQELLKVIGEK